MDDRLIAAVIDKIRSYDGPELTFMEVCGTHTMSVAKFGIRELLPKSVRLISGPGCPVCVTPIGYVDHAIALSRLDNVTITTFGDMMRVPGSGPEKNKTPNNLTSQRSEGADIRVVYSPLDALALAEKHPDKEVVFLGVGFETTAPGLALTIKKAKERSLCNFSMLTAAKTIPQAMTVLAEANDLALDGFLLPGHVSAITGTHIFEPFAEKLQLACSVAGFEPMEILTGIHSLVHQSTTKQYIVDNCYKGVVKPEGNPAAVKMMDEVFEPCDSRWRGIGEIAKSGLAIQSNFQAYDAAKKFTVTLPPPKEPAGCRCGDVLKGKIRPEACGLFAKACTPANPKGACMVSSEGSCAASYNYRDLED